MDSQYESETEIEEVVCGFESCLTPKDRFPHRSHLTAAVWYLRHATFEQAVETLRLRLFNFLDHHGVGRQKYNETLTIFWLLMVQQSMERTGKDRSLVKITNAVVAALSDSRLAFEYYSRDLLNSDEARSKWVEPDLKFLGYESSSPHQPTEP